MPCRRTGPGGAGRPFGIGLAGLLAFAPVPAGAQPVSSEARLGNVVIDCAELPEQVLRRLSPCQTYYQDIQPQGDGDGIMPVGDPIVTLSNGMIFHCSELEDAGRQVPECAADTGVGRAGAPHVAVEHP